jgi:hypothetical protein
MNEIATNAEKSRAFEPYIKDLLHSIFVEARGSYLTPDVAMEILEEILGSRISSSGIQPNESSNNPRFLRADMAVFRRKIHHYAVDLYYESYFPRRKRTSGKSKRGATALPDDYLDELLKMTRQGVNLQKMADKLGHFGPKGKDRVRKQRDLAIKLFSETAERIRRLGALQKAREAAKATLQPAPSDSPRRPAPAVPISPKRKNTQRKK